MISSLRAKEGPFYLFLHPLVPNILSRCIHRKEEFNLAASNAMPTFTSSSACSLIAVGSGEQSESGSKDI